MLPLDLLAEQLAILRRTAERGLHEAARHWVASKYLDKGWNSQIDCWQHMLDEIARTAKYLDESQLPPS